jgi:hypothetical protein
MVLVEHTPHFAHVDAICRRLLPGQVGDPLHVVERHLILGAGRVHGAHARQLAARGLVGLLRRLGLAQPIAQQLELFVLVAAFAELAADRAHLLAKQQLALRLAHLVLHHVRDFFFDAVDLRLTAHLVEHHLEARAHVERLEDGLLLLGGERQVRRDQVAHRAGLMHVLEHHGHLARRLR